MADRISQAVIEVPVDSGDAVGRISQIVIEVILCSGTPLSIACPVGGSTATVGVPYTAMIVVSGGTPPYTYALVS